MEILKKLIGTRNKVNVGSEKESKKFLDDLNMVIGEAKKLVSSAPKINNLVENAAVNIVDGFFYSNLINNFRNNLTDENLEEFNIPKEDVEKIQQNFKDIFGFNLIKSYAIKHLFQFLLRYFQEIAGRTDFLKHFFYNRDSGRIFGSGA